VRKSAQNPLFLYVLAVLNEPEGDKTPSGSFKTAVSGVKTPED